jgi:hypothetical protein
MAEEFFFFVVLVFGLSPAGQVLGRILKPLLSFLAQEGVRLLVYIDDGRGAASTKELLAFLRTLQHKGEFLSSKGPVTLWWLTDNSNVSKCLSKGSGKLPIMYLVLEVLRLARSLFSRCQTDLGESWSSLAATGRWIVKADRHR